MLCQVSTSRRPDRSDNEDGEHLPGQVACSTGGTLMYLGDGTGLFEKLRPYVNFLIETSSSTTVRQRWRRGGGGGGRVSVVRGCLLKGSVPTQ